MGRRFEFPGFIAYTVILDEGDLELIQQREEV